MKTKRAPRAQNGKTKPAPDSSVNNGAAHESSGKHVGDLLREAREARNLTIDMVADELMIRRFYLDVLEKGAFGDLPERVYATGFVKNYANYLELDVKAMIDQFTRDAYGVRHGSAYQVTLNMPEPVAHSAVPGRSVMVTALIVLAVVVGGVIWMTQKDKPVIDTIPEPVSVQDDLIPNAADIPVPAAPTANQSAVDQPAFDQDIATDANAASAAAPDGFISATPNNTVTSDAVNGAVSGDAGQVAANPDDAASTAPAVVTNTATENAVPETPAAPAVNVKNHRVLEAIQASWVEVRDERNTILFTNILKSGQILPLPDGVRLTVTAGNAGGLRLLVDGQPQPVFGQPNEVKRNMVIAPRPLDRQ